MFSKTLKNSQENKCARVSFLIKLQASGLRPATLLKKRASAQLFPREFCEIFKNTFSSEHLRATDSEPDQTFKIDHFAIIVNGWIYLKKKTDSSTGVFKKVFWKIFKNIYFIEHIRETDSKKDYWQEYSKKSSNFLFVVKNRSTEKVARRCSSKLGVLNFIKKKTPTQVFSCEIWEIFKNNFFTEHRWLLLEV